MGYTPQQLREIAKVILAHGSLESTFDNFQTSSNEKVERKLAEAIDFYERTVPMEIRAEIVRTTGDDLAYKAKMRLERRIYHCAGCK